MDAVTSSLLPIRYTAPGVGTYVFRSPTVREAILLYGLLPEWEDPSCYDRLSSVFREWLGPSGLPRRLYELGIGRETCILLIARILDSCQPEDLKKEPEEGDPSSWVKDGSLGLMISEYRHWYNSDPLDEPWPYFLEQARNLESVKSDMGLAQLRWYVATKTEGAIDGLLKQAGFRKQTYEEMFPDQPLRMPQHTDNADAVAQLGMIFYESGVA